MVVQEHVYVDVKEQIVIPIQVPVPKTLIEQKIVPVECIIPQIEQVDRVIEKIVPIIEQKAGRVEVKDRIV